ncbi:MAG TPA: hypothetical protein VJA46_05880 [Acidimicrobiia bacterium]|nr:hypothetical protein [Acidimicrobiia bacterium]
MSNVLPYLSIGIALVAVGMGWRRLSQGKRHRRQDEARDVVRWAQDAGRLASDLARAWQRNLGGGGKPDDSTQDEWVETERRLRLDQPILIGRLRPKLRAKIEDPAHDLMTAAGALLSGSYISHLRQGEYRGANPFEFLDEGFEWREFGRWLNATADAIIEPLEKFARR